MFSKNLCGKMPTESQGSVKVLRIACIIIWAAVFLMIGCLCSKVYAKQRIPPQTSIEKELEEEQNKIAIPTMLEKSISICQEEYAVDIAHAVNLASAKYQIPHYVIYAIIATESGKHRTEDITNSNVMMVNYKASSCFNCKGLMQVSSYAIEDYNKVHNTKYTLEDMYNIYVNIDVGTWYFSQFRTVATSWTEMYIIYNVGYGFYTKRNPYWFYSWNGVWYNNYRNSFFLMNGMLPPDESCNKGLYGKNKLPTYRPKDRFEKCLDLCYQHFNN
ncbi:MAG: lytic transglycosylase domain-containing protein [Lachnospiraceae bacterium]|nr:lytic transglycosylase domain-containing protein [Lachnospiraceae bacterium]